MEWCFLQHVANSEEDAVLEGKVRLGSVPAERMHIVGGATECLMQVGHAGRGAVLYPKGIGSSVLIPDRAAPFWKSDFSRTLPSACSVIADYREICW